MNLFSWLKDNLSMEKWIKESPTIFPSIYKECIQQHGASSGQNQ